MQAPANVPSLVRALVGLLSGALLVSGIAGAVAGTVVPPKPAWAVIGFEAVIAFSSLFGLLLAAGKVRQAPALAIASIAGAAFVGTVLGYLSVKHDLAHLPLKAWLLSRAGLAAALGACAVKVALGTDGAAWRTLVRAALWALPLVGVAAWYRLARFAPLDTPMPGFRDSLRLAAIAAVAIACAVCVCAAIHLSIRAFTLADESRRRD